MAGTKEGGAKAAATNRAKYGTDFYQKIGAKGGKNGHTGGFAAGDAGRERARIYGAVGGRKSKRGPVAPKTGVVFDGKQVIPGYVVLNADEPIIPNASTKKRGSLLSFLKG